MASDMRLNDKPIAKDGAYIYAEAADGSQVKISKADLAAVVAGQIGVPTQGDNRLSDGVDLNDVTQPKAYSGDPARTYVNIPQTDVYFTLLCFKYEAAWPILIQLFMSTSGALFIRFKWNVNPWGKWVTLS